MKPFAAFGLPVVLSTALRDGEVMIVSRNEHGGTSAVLIGTRPMTDVEFAGAQAAYAVRSGLAQRIPWLGVEVGAPPVQSGRGERLFATLRAQVSL